MFMSDNGPCASGDAPSHVLEEGLQMSPATRALPLPFTSPDQRWCKTLAESTARVSSLPF